MELARRAASETDSAKCFALVKELNEALWKSVSALRATEQNRSAPNSSAPAETASSSYDGQQRAKALGKYTRLYV